jgi:hypothetical protein
VDPTSCYGRYISESYQRISLASIRTYFWIENQHITFTLGIDSTEMNTVPVVLYLGWLEPPFNNEKTTTLILLDSLLLETYSHGSKNGGIHQQREAES